MKLLEKILKYFQSKNGLRPLIKDVRDLHFKELLLGKHKTKFTRHELAPYFIENQFYLSVCSFEACANVLALYFGKPVSVRWLVAKAWQQGRCAKYGSATVKDGPYIARKFGVVFEEDLPSDESMSWDNFIDIDFHNLDALAEKNKIGSYYLIDTPSEYLQAIDEGYGVILGRDWKLSTPFAKPWLLTRSGRTVGPHATAGVGYDHNGQTIIGINSWGKDWGDKGRYYLSASDLQQDLDTFGAIAITPIPYTPKELQIKAWQAQVNYIMGLIQGYKARDTFYKTALELYRSGVIVSPENKKLGCGYAMTKVWNTAFPDRKLNLVGTSDWWEHMKKSADWEEILEPEPDCVIVYPTQAIPPQSPLSNGHILLCGHNNAPNGSKWLLSNNSDTGKLDAHWSIKSAQDYYHGYGAIPRFCFRLLK